MLPLLQAPPPAFRTRTTPHLPAPELLLSDLYPPAPQPFTALEAQAAVAFKELTTIIDNSGLMAAPKYLSGYSVEILRYAFCLSIFIGCWYAGVHGGVGSAPGEAWKQALILWTSAVGLGVFWHIMSFTAHDIGHRSLANGSYFCQYAQAGLDHLRALADSLLRLSYQGTTFSVSSFLTAWEVSRSDGGAMVRPSRLLVSLGPLLTMACFCLAEHNIHHHMTNDLEHDPDVQQLPFLALNKGSLDNLWSTRYKEYKVRTGCSSIPRSNLHADCLFTCSSVPAAV